MALFMQPSQQSGASEYHTIYPQQAQPLLHDQGPPVHPAGQFGRMSLSPDAALEKLAGNVRAATTTSASDRAKQIFVQAW
jgi:regulatory factor X